ncbi:hypothetical protein JXA85_07805 [Candidatus Woesearchaeota archaeon]|nr:hypothetical protein [Candidatus Woesearchaeota archaeon]
MPKISSRVKRAHKLSTHMNHYHYFHQGVGRKSGPRTFKTAEAAHAWAAKLGLKQEEYILKKVKRNKKFQIVRK